MSASPLGTVIGSGAQSRKSPGRESVGQETDSPGMSSLRGWWEMELSLGTSYRAGL